MSCIKFFCILTIDIFNYNESNGFFFNIGTYLTQ